MALPIPTKNPELSFPDLLKLTGELTDDLDLLVSVCTPMGDIVVGVLQFTERVVDGLVWRDAPIPTEGAPIRAQALAW